MDFIFKNDLSDNLIEDSNDQYIRTYPYIIELNPGEWITRMAIPEYYNVYTDIPEKVGLTVIIIHGKR